MDFFIREAWAQDAAVGGGDTTAMLVQFGPLILIFAIFYFLIIRPQQKRQKELRAMLSALGKGDKVVTNERSCKLGRDIGAVVVSILIGAHAPAKQLWAEVGPCDWAVV